EAGDDEAMTNPVQSLRVPRQPRYRADRPGQENQSIGVTMAGRCQLPRQLRQYSDPGEVVVRHRWMAAMGREQELVAGFPRKKAFSVGQTSRRQCGIDADFVLPGRQR